MDRRWTKEEIALTRKAWALHDASQQDKFVGDMQLVVIYGLCFACLAVVFTWMV